MLALVLVAAVVAAVSGFVGGPGSSGAAADGLGTTCTAPAGATQQDVDTDDSPEYPWARTPGQPVTVSFATGSLPARYARFVEQGVRMWSAGPCVKAVAVARCAEGAACTTVAVGPGRGDDGETDGESSGTEQGGVRTANAITLYPDLLDDASDNGALATVVHEMGHALGLVHRNDEGSVMNAETDDDTDPRPDATDFHNLLVIYGTARG